jgi:hypothetical protein
MSRLHDVPVRPSFTLVSNWLDESPETGIDRERRLHGGVTLEEAIRVRAYQLWERAGHPEGNGTSFWLEAETQLLAHG